MKIIFTVPKDRFDAAKAKSEETGEDIYEKLREMFIDLLREEPEFAELLQNESFINGIKVVDYKDEEDG